MLYTTPIILQIIGIVILIIVVVINSSEKISQISNEWIGNNLENTLPFGIIWMAPFFSGGGYCSEATSYIKSLSLFDDIRLTINQHGDVFSYKYLERITPQISTLLKEKYAKRNELLNKNSVVICHSEPGAWHPARYSTSRCPPQHGKLLFV